MNREEFAESVERVRKSHPTWFDLEPDERLDPERRGEIEEALGARLPDDYVWFLREYGGGDFAFGSIYSADDESDLFLLRNQDPSLDGRAIAFSDDGTGNIFGFPIVHGVAENKVLIYEHNGYELRPAEDEDFFDFVKRVCLRSGADC